MVRKIINIIVAILFLTSISLGILSIYLIIWNTNIFWFKMLVSSMFTFLLCGIYAEIEINKDLKNG